MASEEPNKILVVDDSPQISKALSDLLSASGYSVRTAPSAERALQILEFVKLDEKKDVPGHLLVAAERKRLELARALALKPEFLLLDETFSGLNDTEVAEAIKLIFRIREEWGVTIFLIEHVMKAVMGTCEKLFVIQYGVKLAEGSPEEVSSNQAVIEAYLGKKKRHA